MLSEEERKKIIDKLKERIGSRYLFCPICNHNQFQMNEGYVIHVLNDEIDKLKEHYEHILTAMPTIPITCTNCGFVSMHSVGILGLLKKD